MDDLIFNDLFEDMGDGETNEEETNMFCRALAYDILKAKNICVVTGAGISVSSGIPDFRSKEGIWKRYDPSVYGTMSGFMSQPQNFWKMSMEMQSTMANKEPTKAHYALTKLQQMGKLQHIITQNVDGLHQESGSENVHEVHGTVKRCRCIECDYQIAFDELLKENEKPWENVPRCPKCNNLVKLDVILFGEELNNDIYQEANDIVNNCDLLMVIGCSMEVNPVNLFPGKAKMNQAQVAIINLTSTKCDNVCDYVLRGEADTLIPKIVDYVESIEAESIGLDFPIVCAKKVFGFFRDIVCKVVELGVQHLELAIEELRGMCQMFGDDFVKFD